MRLAFIIAAWLLLSGFTLKWVRTDGRRQDADDTATAFIIEHKPEHGGWRTHATVPADQESFIIEETTGLHCYRIRARNDAGASGPSDVRCEFN